MCVVCGRRIDYDGESWAENLHQILSKAWLYLRTDLHKVAKSVWRGVYELHMSVLVVQFFQDDWQNVNSDEHSGRPATSRTEKNIFFIYKGIVHHEYAPPCQTVNKEYYCDVLRHLRDAIHWKRPKLHVSGEWQLHHDDAPAHSAQLVQQFLAKYNIPRSDSHCNSPDLTPYDIFLFPKIKSHLKGRFPDFEEIQVNVVNQLLIIPENKFQECFHQWKQRRIKCVASEGDHFKGK